MNFNLKKDSTSSDVTRDHYITHFAGFKPSIGIENRGTNYSHFRFLSSLAIDDESGTIFLVDSSLLLLILFSNTLDFLTCISLENLNTPNGIAVYKDSVLVTDLCAVFLIKEENGFCFSKSIGSFGSGNDQFMKPSHPDISSRGDLYIPDDLNHRIQVYNNDLVFLYSLKNTHLRNPVNVKVRSTMIYVLSYPPFSSSYVHIFLNSRNGELLKSIELQQDGVYIRSIFFSIDRHAKIFLFREVAEGVIHIFSNSWKLLYSIKLEKTSTGYSYLFPEGMAVTKDLNIVTVSYLNRRYTLQLYSK